MPVGRPMPALQPSAEELSQLQRIASSRTMPHSLVQRAQIILACAAGESNIHVARRLGIAGATVGKWRQRYLELGIAGLQDEPRPGRPRTYADEEITELIQRVLQTRPLEGRSHWSARSLAAETGISKSTIHRWLQNNAVEAKQGRKPVPDASSPLSRPNRHQQQNHSADFLSA